MSTSASMPMQKLSAYMALPSIASIKFSTKAKTFTFACERTGTRRTAPGLIGKLRAHFYPTAAKRKKRKKRNFRKRKHGTTYRIASSKPIGIAADDAINAYIASGLTVAPKNAFARAVIHYWECELGHVVVASQLPVRVADFGCITAVDTLTRDKQGRIWLWELKTGRGARAAPRGPKLRGPRTPAGKRVPASVINQWELQRHYTVKGLRDAGVDIYKSHVIHAYKEKVKGSKRKPQIKVLKRAVPTWTRSL